MNDSMDPLNSDALKLPPIEIRKGKIPTSLPEGKLPKKIDVTLPTAP